MVESSLPRPAPVRVRARASAPGHGMEDLLSGLVWPRLFAAPRIAARAGHVLMGVLAVMGIWVADGLPRWVGLTPATDPGFFGAWITLALLGAREALGAVLGLDGAGAVKTLAETMGRVPMGLIRAAPWAALLTLVVALVVVAVCAGGIGRSAALIVGGERPGSFVRRLRGSWRMLPSFVGVLVVPWLLAPMVMLLVEAISYALLRVPYAQVLGAVFLGVPLVLTLVAVVLMVLGVLATPILLAAVSTEASDAIDALQRCYAYALRGGVRLVMYYVITGAVGLVAVGAAVLLASGVRFAFVRGATAWLPQNLAGALEGTIDPGVMAHQASVESTGAVAGWWAEVPMLVAMGYLFSYVVTGGVLCYVGIRRIVDGQDMGEVWAGDDDRAGGAGDAGDAGHAGHAGDSGRVGGPRRERSGEGEERGEE